jgi:hypothetical protein
MRFAEFGRLLVAAIFAPMGIPRTGTIGFSGDPRMLRLPFLSGETLDGVSTLSSELVVVASNLDVSLGMPGFVADIRDGNPRACTVEGVTGELGDRLPAGCAAVDGLGGRLAVLPLPRLLAVFVEEDDALACPVVSTEFCPLLVDARRVDNILVFISDDPDADEVLVRLEDGRGALLLTTVPALRLAAESERTAR